MTSSIFLVSLLFIGISMVVSMILKSRFTAYGKIPLASRLTGKEIAEKMFVSVRTVEGYRDALCEKLELKSRVGLAMYAVKNGIIDQDA